MDQVIVIKDGPSTAEVKVNKIKGFIKPDVEIIKISGLPASKIVVEIS